MVIRVGVKNLKEMPHCGGRGVFLIDENGGTWLKGKKKGPQLSVGKGPGKGYGRIEKSLTLSVVYGGGCGGGGGVTTFTFLMKKEKRGVCNRKLM